MKKVISWSLLLVSLLIGIGIYNLSRYELEKELFNFPIPKNAELLKKKEIGIDYSWSKATFEHGIPFDYEIVLWTYDWKKGEIEGGSVLYTKENHTIDLTSSTDYLYIMRVNY